MQFPCSSFFSTRQYPVALPHPATPIATTPIQDLPQSFFARPAEVVAPDLIGCLLVKQTSASGGARMHKTLGEKDRSSSISKRASPGQQQLPFAFDFRFN